jgi:membrane fusion protein, multidrug efflux system
MPAVGWHEKVMKLHRSASLDAPRFRAGHAISGLAIAVLAGALSACQDLSAGPANRALYVRTEVVQPRDRQTSVTLTGEVRARISADLSFRVSGRVLARYVDVGAHVAAGDVLARLDPAEQQADLDAAVAAEAAARSQLRVAGAAFERQKTLIAQGFTTRSAFDQAQEALHGAEAALDAAKAQVGRAQDALSYTELKAGAAGVVTARNLELGQVVQAGQAVFTLAHDGERDAVFDVDESIFFRDVDGERVSLGLVSNPHVTATGHVREVSPAVDPKSSTIRVKVAIDNPPTAMTLGTAVVGTARSHSAAQITLPWTALMASGSQPAVWIVDPATKTASLRPVVVSGFEAGTVVVSSGLETGERVVIDGGKLLSRGQAVTFREQS